MDSIILLSGGLDSSTILAKAIQEGKQCLALSFDYRQRHRIELFAAEKIAKHYNVPHKVISIDPTVFSHSALLNNEPIASNRTIDSITNGGIPNTYVPARNTLFLAYAVGQAEVYGANEIQYGANIMDANPYPDCSPDYISAYQQLINQATAQAVTGNAPTLLAPLLRLTKKEIVKLAKELQVPIHLTHSCYDPTEEGKPCLKCDACMLRGEAIAQLEK